jgi:SAM-dependent methyltransferase
MPMAQNIYDQPDFFAGYSTLPRSVRGLAGAPEWPAVRALLPPLAGRRIVDLGCGFGWFARFAAEEGAGSVLALDLSEKMLARARAENAHPAIEYRIADLDTLQLPEASFDLAYSALAFHYVADFARLAGVVHRALALGGALVFTIEHPIYMASRHPGWLAHGDGGRAWPVDRYAVEGERRTDWYAKGVLKYHRKLATTLNALIDAGLAIRHLDEWSPGPEQLEALPALADEMDRPMMLIVSASR